jgi:hypothetical protein
VLLDRFDQKYLITMAVQPSESHDRPAPATPDQSTPSSSRREEFREADSEEEDEVVAFRFLFTSSIFDLVERGGPQDLRTAAFPTANGLLHQLHRSWQLLC